MFQLGSTFDLLWLGMVKEGGGGGGPIHVKSVKNVETTATSIARLVSVDQGAGKPLSPKRTPPFEFSKNGFVFTKSSQGRAEDLSGLIILLLGHFGALGRPWAASRLRRPSWGLAPGRWSPEVRRGPQRSPGVPRGSRRPPEAPGGLWRRPGGGSGGGGRDDGGM